MALLLAWLNSWYLFNDNNEVDIVFCYVQWMMNKHKNNIIHKNNKFIKFRILININSNIMIRISVIIVMIILIIIIIIIIIYIHIIIIYLYY